MWFKRVSSLLSNWAGLVSHVRSDAMIFRSMIVRSGTAIPAENLLLRKRLAL